MATCFTLKIVHEGLRYLFITCIASAAGIHIKKNPGGADINLTLSSKMKGHREAPAKFIPGEGKLLSPRKKARPDTFSVLSKKSNSEMLYDVAKQPKSSVSSKNKAAPENKPSDTLEEMVPRPRMHPTFKQRYHYCFCGVPGKQDIIKEAHSSNFNRCFLTCAQRRCRFFQWIN